VSSPPLLDLRVFERPIGSDGLVAIWMIIVVTVSAVAKNTVLGDPNTMNLPAFSIAYPLLLTTAVTIFSSRAQRVLTVSSSAVIIGAVSILSLTLQVLTMVLHVTTKNRNFHTLTGAEFVWNFSQAVLVLFMIFALSVATVRSLRYAILGSAEGGALHRIIDY